MTVVVVRGDLVRRYPARTTSSSRAAPSRRRDRDRARLRGHARRRDAFFGCPALDPDDVRAGYFVAIEEQSGAPRFGLDKAAPADFTQAAQLERGDLGALVTSQEELDALTHARDRQPAPRRARCAHGARGAATPRTSPARAGSARFACTSTPGCSYDAPTCRPPAIRPVSRLRRWTPSCRSRCCPSGSRRASSAGRAGAAVRIFPDAIHADGHADALTEAEQALGRAFWRRSWRAGMPAGGTRRSPGWPIARPVARRLGGRAVGALNRRRAARPVADDRPLAPPPKFPRSRPSPPARRRRRGCCPSASPAGYVGGELQARGGPRRSRRACARAGPVEADGGVDGAACSTPRGWNGCTTSRRPSRSGWRSGSRCRASAASTSCTWSACARRPAGGAGGSAERPSLHERARLHRAGHADQHDRDRRRGNAARPERAARGGARAHRGGAAAHRGRGRPVSDGRRRRGGDGARAGRRHDARPRPAGCGRAAPGGGDGPGAVAGGRRPLPRRVLAAPLGGDDRAWLRDWSGRFARGGAPLPTLLVGPQPYGLLPVSGRDARLGPAGRISRCRTSGDARRPLARLGGGRPAARPRRDRCPAGRRGDRVAAVAQVLGAVPHATSFRLAQVDAMRATYASSSAGGCSSSACWRSPGRTRAASPTATTGHRLYADLPVQRRLRRARRIDEQVAFAGRSPTCSTSSWCRTISRPRSRRWPGRSATGTSRGR